MRRFFECVVLALVLVGCNGAKTGGAAAMPNIPIYPGSTVISNGENQGVIGANLEIVEDRGAVIQFYATALGTKPDPSGAGNLEGTIGGHKVSVIVTDAGGGKTAVAITEQK